MSDTEAPDNDADLDDASRLLLWSFRLVLSGELHCPILAATYRDSFGADAKPVFAALSTFLGALARGSRHCLVIGPPHYPFVTPDERRMLTIVAAAQEGWQSLLDSHLCWITTTVGRSELERAAVRLAALLHSNDRHLRLSHAQHFTEPRPARLPRLHQGERR